MSGRKTTERRPRMRKKMLHQSLNMWRACGKGAPPLCTFYSRIQLIEGSFSIEHAAASSARVRYAQLIAAGTMMRWNGIVASQYPISVRTAEFCCPVVYSPQLEPVSARKSPDHPVGVKTAWPDLSVLHYWMRSQISFPSLLSFLRFSTFNLHPSLLLGSGPPLNIHALWF